MNREDEQKLLKRNYYDTDIGKVCMTEEEYEEYLIQKLLREESAVETDI